MSFGQHKPSKAAGRSSKQFLRATPEGYESFPVVLSGTGLGFTSKSSVAVQVLLPDILGYGMCRIWFFAGISCAGSTQVVVSVFGHVPSGQSSLRRGEDRVSTVNVNFTGPVWLESRAAVRNCVVVNLSWQMVSPVAVTVNGYVPGNSRWYGYVQFDLRLACYTLFCIVLELRSQNLRQRAHRTVRVLGLSHQTTGSLTERAPAVTVVHLAWAVAWGKSPANDSISAPLHNCRLQQRQASGVCFTETISKAGQLSKALPISPVQRTNYKCVRWLHKHAQCSARVVMDRGYWFSVCDAGAMFYWSWRLGALSGCWQDVSSNRAFIGVSLALLDAHEDFAAGRQTGCCAKQLWSE